MSTDRAFCLPCMLFGGPSASSTWSRDGWKDWRNGIHTIDQHEHSKEHKASEIDKASEIARFHWISGRSLSRITMKPNNVVINDNRQVLSCIIDFFVCRERHLASSLSWGWMIFNNGWGQLIIWFILGVGDCAFMRVLGREESEKSCRPPHPENTLWNSR